MREILRLKHACGASDRAIVRPLGVARSTVALTLDRLAAAGLVWPLPETLSERVLQAMLYAGTGSKPGFRRKTEPDWTHVHRELRRPGVTLMLLWEEYRGAEPDGYAYSRWCGLYRAWEGRVVARADVYRRIDRRAAGVATRIGCHSWRAISPPASRTAACSSEPVKKQIC